MKKVIINRTFYSDGSSDVFKWGGILLTFDCSHEKKFDGWFPVPVPKPDEEYECEQCDA